MIKGNRCSRLKFEKINRTVVINEYVADDVETSIVSMDKEISNFTKNWCCNIHRCSKQSRFQFERKKCHI